MTERRGSKRGSKPKAKFLSPEVLHRACKAVAKIDSKAVLVGGYALQAFGSRRLTGDLDVLVAEVPDDVKALKRLSFGGIRAVVGGVPTDFIARDDEVADLYEEARLAAIKVSGFALRVVPPEYILVLKIWAGRPKDDSDVATILGWDIDRKKTLEVAKRYLGLVAARDLKQVMDIADWKRSRGIADDDE
jgi:hypothetical protein